MNHNNALRSVASSVSGIASKEGNTENSSVAQRLDAARQGGHVPPILYGCSICQSLSFNTKKEAIDHCKTENKGVRRDSQWYHVIEARKA